MSALVAACGIERPQPAAGVDATPQVWPDAAPGVEVDNREVSDIIVSPTHVAWSQFGESCPITHGPDCPAVAPTVSSADLLGGAATALFANALGVRCMAGDENGLFAVVVAQTGESIFAINADPNVAPVQLTTSGAIDVFRYFAVDADYVYWTHAPDGVYRAARTGDGSDAAPLGVAAQRDVVQAGGMLWWMDDAMIYRVSTAGGTPDAVAVSHGSIVGTTPTSVLITLSIDDRYAILRAETDGTLATLIAHLVWRPLQVRVEGDDFFWRSTDGSLRRAPLATGSPVDTVQSPDPASQRGPFAVTPTAILVDFTRDGYRAIPR